MLHELLPPGAADGYLLAFQALLQMQTISLLAASRDVLLDKVAPDCREDSPEETTIWVASQVHLVAGHILDNLRIIANLMPDVLRSVLWQVVPDPVADNNFSTGEAKLRLLKNRLDEGHAAVLLYRQPGVTLRRSDKRVLTALGHVLVEILLVAELAHQRVVSINCGHF